MVTSARAYRQSHVPRPRTALIGRDREMARIRTLLEREDVGLVTLTGPGGVGKTRLALEIAKDAGRTFPDGVIFVQLAAVATPAQVPLAIAQAMGVQEATSDALLELLVWLLQHKRLLLMLDNMENVIAAADLVGDLLTACPELVILATSRQPLALRGEHEVRVTPLAVISTAGDSSLPAAVQLFVERAQAAQSDFQLHDGNVAAVHAICQRLDGLPLAIELAAARVKVLQPAALLDRLEPSLPLLTGGPRDAAARHRTLRDTIAWSYDRLHPDEQWALRQLAVFVGGCSLPAAEAILDGGRHAGSALDTVATLVDQSLLLATEHPAGHTRLLLLETVREFACGALVASGEAEAARARHAAWAVALVSDAPGTVFTDPANGLSLEVMDAELSNIRAACDWLAGAGQQRPLLRLLAAARGYFGVRPLQREVVLWLDACLDAPHLDVRDQATGHVLATLMHYDLDTGAPVRAHAEAALSHLEVATDSRVTCEVRYCAGVALEYSGDLAAARLLQDSALGLAREAGWRMATATILAEIGGLQLLSGEITEAVSSIDEALAIHRDLGPSWSFVTALGERAHVGWLQHRPQLAATCYAEGIRIAEMLGDLRKCLDMVAGMSAVALALGQPERGARLLGAVNAVRDTSGIRTSGVRALLLRITRELRATLPEEAFDAAWQAGRELSFSAAQADALALAAEAVTPVSPAKPPRPLGLTPREIAVVRLLAQGMSDREIAGVLTIGARTVQTHVSNAFAKLGVNTRAEAVAVAVRRGVI